MIILEVAGLVMIVAIIVGVPIMAGWLIIHHRERQLLSFDRADTFWSDTMDDIVTRRLTPSISRRMELGEDTVVIPRVGAPDDDTELIPQVGRITSLEPSRAAEADWFFQQDPLGASSLPEQLEPNLIGVQVLIDLVEQKVFSGGTLDIQVSASWVPWGYELTS